MRKAIIILGALLSYNAYSQNSVDSTFALQGQLGPCIIGDETNAISYLPFYHKNFNDIQLKVIVDDVAVDDSTAFLKSIIGADALSIKLKPYSKPYRVDSLHKNSFLIVNTHPKIRMKKLKYCPYLSYGHIVTWTGMPDCLILKSARSVYRQQLVLFFPMLIVDDVKVLESNDELYFDYLMNEQYSRILFIEKEEAEKKGYNHAPTGGIIMAYH